MTFYYLSVSSSLLWLWELNAKVSMLKYLTLLTLCFSMPQKDSCSDGVVVCLDVLDINQLFYQFKMLT